MTETYFGLCPICKHQWITHLDIIAASGNHCGGDGGQLCDCRRRPPRYYVYDKDPSVIKDVVTLNHFELATHNAVGVEEMVERVVDALNLMDERERLIAAGQTVVTLIVELTTEMTAERLRLLLELGNADMNLPGLGGSVVLGASVVADVNGVVVN